MERNCFVCGDGITAAFGYTFGRDIMPFLNGEREDPPREICGKDVLRLSYHVVNGELVHRPWNEIEKDLEKYIKLSE